MAIIKAGTYRFNDVLTEPSGYLSQEIDFTVRGILSLDTATNVISLVEGEAYCTEIVATNEGYGFSLAYISKDFIWFWGITAYDESYGFDIAYYNFLESGKILPETVKGYGQTITIPTDQEVSDEFYDWFKDNTECMLSGTWQLNDVILPPAVNLYVSAPFISNGVIYQRGAVITLGSYSGAVIIYSTEERYDVYEPHTVVVYADGEAKTMFEENYDITIQEGWLDDSYKTVTFAKAGFSGEWYNWFTTNANQVVEDIDYLIKLSTLSSIADSIRIKTGKTNNITPAQMPDEIMSIVGSEGTDTSDATATEDTILLGFTAYNNGAKITGTIETYEGESSKNEVIILSGEEAMF